MGMVCGQRGGETGISLVGVTCAALTISFHVLIAARLASFEIDQQVPNIDRGIKNESPARNRRCRALSRGQLRAVAERLRHCGALLQVLKPTTSKCPETSLDASLARQPL